MIKATENACLKGHPLDNNWKWSTAKLWLSHVQKNKQTKTTTVPFVLKLLIITKT